MRAFPAPRGLPMPDSCSKPDEIDMGAPILKETGTTTYVVPGEHDLLDNGVTYRARLGMKGADHTWHGFDQHGVHFAALNNVAGFSKAG